MEAIFDKFSDELNRATFVSGGYYEVEEGLMKRKGKGVIGKRINEHNNYKTGLARIKEDVENEEEEGYDHQELNLEQEEENINKANLESKKRPKKEDMYQNDYKEMTPNATASEFNKRTFRKGLQDNITPRTENYQGEYNPISSNRNQNDDERPTSKYNNMYPFPENDDDNPPNNEEDDLDDITSLVTLRNAKVRPSSNRRDIDDDQESQFTPKASDQKKQQNLKGGNQSRNRSRPPAGPDDISEINLTEHEGESEFFNREFEEDMGYTDEIKVLPERDKNVKQKKARNIRDDNPDTRKKGQNEENSGYQSQRGLNSQREAYSVAYSNYSQQEGSTFTPRRDLQGQGASKTVGEEDDALSTRDKPSQRSSKPISQRIKQSQTPALNSQRTNITRPLSQRSNMSGLSRRTSKFNKTSYNDYDLIESELSISEIARKEWEFMLYENSSIMVDLFQGQVKTSLKCLSCGNLSHKFEPYSYISLPVPKVSEVKLEDSLQDFLKTERLGESDTWYCSHCNTKTRAIKKMDLLILPNILIFHLSRFEIEDEYQMKLETLIKFPVEELDMRPFASIAQREPPIYRLYGIAEHEGTLDNGHYASVIRHQLDGKWYYFDDEIVSIIANSKNEEDNLEEALVTPRAYLLFYSKISTPSFTRQSVSFPDRWPIDETKDGMFIPSKEFRDPVGTLKEDPNLQSWLKGEKATSETKADLNKTGGITNEEKKSRPNSIQSKKGESKSPLKQSVLGSELKKSALETADTLRPASAKVSTQEDNQKDPIKRAASSRMNSRRQRFYSFKATDNAMNVILKHDSNPIQIQKPFQSEDFSKKSNFKTNDSGYEVIKSRSVDPTRQLNRTLRPIQQGAFPNMGLTTSLMVNKEFESKSMQFSRNADGLLVSKRSSQSASKDAKIVTDDTNGNQPVMFEKLRRLA